MPHLHMAVAARRQRHDGCASPRSSHGHSIRCPHSTPTPTAPLRHPYGTPTASLKPQGVPHQTVPRKQPPYVTSSMYSASATEHLPACRAAPAQGWAS